MRSPTWLLGSVGLAAALVLVGCSDDETASNTPTARSVCSEHYQVMPQGGGGSAEACVTNFSDLCAYAFDTGSLSETECAARFKEQLSGEGGNVPAEQNHGTQQMRQGEPMQYLFPGDPMTETPDAEVELTLQKVTYDESFEGEKSNAGVTLHLLVKNIGQSSFTPDDVLSESVWLGEDATQQEAQQFAATDGQCAENLSTDLRPGRSTEICWDFEVPAANGTLLLFSGVNETAVALNPEEADMSDAWRNDATIGAEEHTKRGQVSYPDGLKILVEPAKADGNLVTYDVTMTNGSEVPKQTDSVMIDASAGKPMKNAAVAWGKTKEFSGTIAPGKSETATYSFKVPTQKQGTIVLEVYPGYYDPDGEIKDYQSVQLEGSVQ